MKNCINCGIKLTKENKSKHQPKIRCLKCFKIFADHVDEVFTEISRNFDEIKNKQDKELTSLKKIYFGEK